jgi:hypothetical protein
MKKIQSIFILLVLLVMLFACDDDNEGISSVDGTFIEKVYPEKVVTGQEIIITGNHFEEVTQVILPGNIAVTDFKKVGFNQITVIAVEGMTDGTIILKAGEIEIEAPNEIRAVLPEYTRIFPEEVAVGEVITIKGENLIEIQQVILPGDLTINSLSFKRKSDTELQIIVPSGITGGMGSLKVITLAGNELVTDEIFFKEEEVVQPELVDPITENTIILLDFEQHGDHNGDWDNSWGGNTEIVHDEEAGNTYLRMTGDATDNWLLNCNHQGDIGDGATWPWTIDNAENYVVKFDVLIPFDVDGAAFRGIQVVLGDQWNYWGGDDLLAETPKGEWVTIRIPFTQWGTTGSLDFSSGTNGLYGSAPQGLAIDNLRIDPL